MPSILELSLSLKKSRMGPLIIPKDDDTFHPLIRAERNNNYILFYSVYDTSKKQLEKLHLSVNLEDYEQALSSTHLSTFLQDAIFAKAPAITSFKFVDPALTAQSKKTITLYKDKIDALFAAIDDYRQQQADGASQEELAVLEKKAKKLFAWLKPFAKDLPGVSRNLSSYLEPGDYYDYLKKQFYAGFHSIADSYRRTEILQFTIYLNQAASDQQVAEFIGQFTQVLSAENIRHGMMDKSVLPLSAYFSIRPEREDVLGAYLVPGSDKAMSVLDKFSQSDRYQQLTKLVAGKAGQKLALKFAEDEEKAAPESVKKTPPAKARH